MSRVTQVVVVAHPVDRSHMEELAFWMTERNVNDDPAYGRVGNLLPLDEGWGGYKRQSSELCAAACNYLDAPGFLAHVAKINWDERAVVQILVQEEEDEYFRLYMLRGDGLREFTPPPEAGPPPIS